MVAAGVAALVSAPLVVRALPAAEQSVSAATLLGRIQASGGAGYSGYAEAVGGLRLPLIDQFSGLADMLGGRTRLRVWWRDARDWRVDAISATGEYDLHRVPGQLWAWDYERNEATRYRDPAVRLPRAADLDPAQLGRRLLSEAVPAEVTRLPARRVAGVDAAGLRLRPIDPRTMISRVDLWADITTGLPLRVEVFAAGAGPSGAADRPVVDTSFLDVSLRLPSPETTRFTPPATARISSWGEFDLAAAADLYSAGQPPPGELAGYPLRRRIAGVGGVGTYGRGVATLAALPLPERIAWRLRDRLADTSGVRETAEGQLLTVGPLSLLLTRPRGEPGQAWLLAGTLTADTLQQAAAELRTAARRG